MTTKNHLASLFDRAWRGAEQRRWQRGRLGRRNADSTTTIAITDRPGWVYVTMGPAGDGSLTVARNVGNVPLRPGLPVRLRREQGVLCVMETDYVSGLLEGDVDDYGEYGVPPHIHDDRYFREDEHLSTSAGAADAGKPIVLDSGGQVDATMINDADIDHTAIGNRGTNTHAQIDTHIASTSNPHGVTKSQVGLGSVDNVQQMPLSYLDTDGTLAANSDVKVASQKAVKTYTDQLIGAANALVYKGVIDCSSNPNYPAANAGDLYVVSVAGKIGGASGVTVDVGDMLLCNTDGTASGNQATVGTKWNVIEKNIVGAVTGPASAVDGRVAVFDGTTGKIIKDSGLTLSGTNTGDVTVSDSTTVDLTLSGQALSAAVIQGGLDHGSIGGLTDDDHSQYALLAGRAGGQILRGGTNALNPLTLDSTSNASKGPIYINPSGGDVGIGTTSPISNVELRRTSSEATLYARSTLGTGYATIAAGSNAGYVGLNVNGSTYTGSNEFGLTPAGVASVTSSDGPLSVGTKQSYDLTLGANNSAVATITSGGNMAVGKTTATSGYKLSVNGKVDATAINVGESDLTVFDDNGTSWTPTITTSGNPPDTLTYTTQAGYYTRFNNVVFYHFTIAINAFSLGTGTGNARFSLPFTAANDAGRRPIAAAMTSTVAWPAGAQQVVFRPTVNAAYGNLSGVQSDATVTVVRLADLAAGDTISVSGFYYI